MADTDSRWPTTTPEARLTSGSEKVSVRDALGPGTRLLEEFEVLRVLGTGGFGIVYLARDHVLQRDIAIKEYMPAALARRGEGATVVLRGSTDGLAQTFAKGLESFLGEARLLASFDHPALVKVHRFWRSNATAYMAMPYYPGRTLKDVRLEMPAAPGEAWLRGLIEPVLGALEQLHAHGVYHRDIAPDNILVLPEGRPVLLDFGCARRAVAGGSQWFTAHLKPQFAPLEQYADEGSCRPGAVDRPVLARRDAVFRRHRPRADRLGGARRARHAAGAFVVAACRSSRPACSAPSTGPSPSRPAIGRGTSRRFDVRSAARSRRRRRGGCRSRPATRAPRRRPLRRRARRRSAKPCRATVCRSRRGEPIAACTGA